MGVVVEVGKQHNQYLGYSNRRIHLTWFCCLNEFLSLDFGYCTNSYKLIQYVSKI
jgi:hypothetical protein